MVQITKDEAMNLREQCGISQIFHTWSHHREKTYYLVENPRNMKALEKYRKSRTIATVTEDDFKNKK